VNPWTGPVGVEGAKAEMRMFVQSPRQGGLPERLCWLVFFISVFLLIFSPAHAQTPPPSRPILFVHGYCDEPESWAQYSTYLAPNIATDLNAYNSTLYPLADASTPADPANYYEVYYDGTTVHFLQNEVQIEETAIPPTARFFLMHFFDPNTGSWVDEKAVSQVSILNKAEELAQVLREINRVTQIKDVIVIAHSMGGLVSRAYLENMASILSCYTYKINGEGLPDYSNGLCLPGGDKYQGEIAQLITIDTPHGGFGLATDVSALNNLLSTCVTNSSTTELEQVPGSQLLQNLNYMSSTIASASTVPSNVEVQAIESSFSDSNPKWELALDPQFYFTTNDGLITIANQSMESSVGSGFKNAAQFHDWTNPYTTESIEVQTACQQNIFGNLAAPVLHFLTCVGSQSNTQTRVSSLVKPIMTGTLDSITVLATLDSGSGPKPWPSSGSGSIQYHLQPSNTISGNTSAIPGTTVPFTFPASSIPVGTYSLVYDGGGPSDASIYASVSPVETILDSENWNPTFTISFQTRPSSFPTVSTGAATNAESDGVTLNASVDPNGTAATAWFEWGTSSTLQTYQTTPQAAIPGGTTAVPFSYRLGGLTSNTSYYFRIATGTGGSPVRGSIQSFTTLNTLPKPTLLTPTNNSTAQSVTPQLSWTAVPNATSYRLLVATSPGALPTDPNQDTCNTGCVLGDTGVTPNSTAFTPTTGQLSASTPYYWEVHARSPSQAGDWSAISNFTTPSVASNDFSLSVSPSSQSVTQGSSVAFNIVTATTSGSGQVIDFSASNVPSGLTATFNPATVTSGMQSAITVTTSSSAPTGSYTLTVTGTGTSMTHTYLISITVEQDATGPAVTLNPNIVRFNSQAVGSVSSPQTVLLMNSGSGQLQVSSIALLAGSDYVLTLPTPAPPNILNSGVPYNIQVAFEPTTTGSRSGEILVYDNAPGSPHTVTLTGTGTPAQPSTGRINVNATLNGTALPSSNSLNYSLVGPATYSGYGPYSFDVTPGTYVASFSGYPSDLTLSSITPSPTQTVSAGGSINYTLNFTAPNDFHAPSFTSPVGGSGVTPQIVVAGTTASYTVSMDNPPSGNASVPVTLAVSGPPPSTAATFSPQPLNTGNSGALTISTDATATSPGVYSLTLTGTNGNGVTHTGATSTLVVTTPPTTSVQSASVNSAGSQANAASSVSYDSASADGRYVVFSTTATNLATGNTYQYPEVYVRDLHSSTTTPASVSNSGVLADSACYGGNISSNGRFVVFWSDADNLYTGSVLNGNSGVYVHDLSLGSTEREDIAPDGTPANGASFGSAISADGRFVAFVSNASNLVSGVSGMQAYLRDRNTRKIVLVTAAMDGSPASSDLVDLAISADGRFVAFVSNATNLVSQNTNGLDEAFVRDVPAGVTYIVSVSSAGAPANASVLNNSGLALALSADGRFIAFSSKATNLVSEPLDDIVTHVFAYDRQAQRNFLVDADSVGTPLGGWPSFTNSAISADGRFVAFYGFEQVLLRDLVANQTAVVSLASNGSAGNGTAISANWDLSLGGSKVVFASGSTNLVPSDTNGVADAFVAQNPFVGSSSLQSVALNSSSSSGGSTVTGTITLSSPAPTGGATVVVWSNNTAAQPPAVVVVPEGATSAPVSLNTSLVPSEAVMTIMASYNGGSSVALLTLEPAPELAVSPATWDFGYQAVGTTSSIESFALTNSGTAALTINSVQLASTQAFKIRANTCGSSIVAAGSCSISVTFTPSMSGSISDAVQISYGSPATIQSISLTGNGATPLASVAPTALNFGNQSMPGSSTAVATLTNSGNASLSNISASISGINAGDYAISSDGCSGVILPANSNCLITISFSPKAKGSRIAALSIADSASGSPQAISLTGTGVQSTPTVLWNPSAVSLTYGTPLGTGVLDASANLNGSNLAGTFAYSAIMSGSKPQTVTQATVLRGGSYTLTAAFTPTDSTDYTTAAATVSITVNQATPTVKVAPSSSSITTAQALTVSVVVHGGSGTSTPTGSVVLSGGGYTSAATALSGGSATISVPAGKLDTGSDILTVSYTPDISSSSTYNIASGTASVVVTKPSTTTELQFIPVTPCRIADTRNATGAFGGPELAAGARAPSTFPRAPAAFHRLRLPIRST
jgi:TolB protein